MVTRVQTNAGAAAPAQGAAQAASPLAAVRDGGQALNLQGGAEAIGGLNLFDEGTGDGSDERGKKAPRNKNTDDQGNDDDDNGNPGANEGDDEGQQPQGDDDQNGEGDGTDDGDDDGQSDEGKKKDDDEGKNSADDDSKSDKPIESLAQLAEALEVDEDFLANLSDQFKADGEDVSVSLAELRSGYQRDANYRRQTQELAQTRTALETEHTQRAQQMQASFVQTAQMMTHAEQILVGEINTAEMTQLRTSNPAEWAARREEMQQRINSVKQLYGHVAQQYDAHQVQQQEILTTQLTALRRTELANLQVAIPDWDDGTRDKLMGYLDTSYGYTDNDLKQIFDSRLITIANKARLFDELQAVGKKTKKKVVNLPNVQKGGKRQGKPAGSKNAANFSKARKALKNSGKLKDAAALIGFIDEI